jgi:hypothetical protein
MSPPSMRVIAMVAMRGRLVACHGEFSSSVKQPRVTLGTGVTLPRRRCHAPAARMFAAAYGNSGARRT